MVNRDCIPADAEKLTHPQTPLQLLLFVDQRPSSHEQLQRLLAYLEHLRSDYPFELEIVDVGQQPYLAEHFKLVATPALVKIHPPPRQTLAGSNLLSQLQDWWPRWKNSAEDYVKLHEWPSTNTQNTPCFADFAELIRLSEEIFRLKKEKEELQQQLQFKDRIIAMLAHDLRNPLTASLIALETLEKNYNIETGFSPKLTPALIMRLIKQARMQSLNIERLITDILQAAQGSCAELRILPKKLDLAVLCQDVIDCLKHRFETKSQELKTDIPNDLPFVYADPERVRQVLVNLLDNANKYTQEGGTIEICILHRTTQKVQVSVGDNGLGVPEEDREAIFEEHYRLKRDRDKEGYGIGLSLCQRIIRAHYGRIWVDSVAKGGSCFSFTLPVYR